MKNFNQIFTTLALALLATATFAQVKVGDNPTTINANAVLEIESTNKGLLLPRVALTGTANTAPMSAHVAGMAVYNTATAGDVTPGYYTNDGTQWVRVTPSAATASNGLTATAGNIALGGALAAGDTRISNISYPNSSLTFSSDETTGSTVSAVTFENKSEEQGRTITGFRTGNIAVDIRTHGTNYNEIFHGVNMIGKSLINANSDLIVGTSGNLNLVAADSLRIGNNSVPVKEVSITGGTATPATFSAAENLVSIFRPGTAAVSAGSGGTIAIGKYLGGTNNSFSSMQFRLAHLLETDLVDVMVLRSDGRVGIGTTGPTAKLDVNGNGIFNATPFGNVVNPGENVLTLNSPGVNGVTFPSVAHLALGRDNASNNNSNTTLAFRLAGQTNGDLREVMKLNRTNATINTTPFGTSANSSGANVLTLTSPGVVGSSFASVAHLAIGKNLAGENSNTTLSFKLAELDESDLKEVMKLTRTNATINTTVFGQNANSGENVLTLRSPGATTGPLSYSSVAHLAIGKTTSNLNSNTTLSFRLAGLADNDLREVMKLQSNGFVGIGTTAPTSRLQVVGLPVHADNAAALAAGLTAGAFYHNGDGIVRAVF